MIKATHCIVKTVFGLLALLLCIMLIVGAFFGIKGYKMYLDAISETPMVEKIDTVRSMEHFTQYSELPQFYIKAVISVEDHRFESHHGIDIIAISRAAWTDIKAMSFVEGGSTITQQLVKNLYFTQEKQVERKFAEVFAAFKLESQYDKPEILELYVNTIYFGSGYYGIYDAAEGYFGKKPSELTDYESAMLAGLPNAPSAYSPNADINLANQRVKQVLNSMIKYNAITQKQVDTILLEHS